MQEFVTDIEDLRRYGRSSRRSCGLARGASDPSWRNVRLAREDAIGAARPQTSCRHKTSRRTQRQQEATLRQAAVLGHQMAYVETGTGRPIALLHGNPHGVLPVPLGAAHPRLALPNPVRRGTG